MISSGHRFRNAPAFGRRVPSFREFMKMGGTCGMIWRIIGGWERPFNLNQVKVAFHRRHPSLIPGAFQISDTLSWLVSIGKLDRIDNCTFQRRQRKAHIQISLRRHPEPQMRMNFL